MFGPWERGWANRTAPSGGEARYEWFVRWTPDRAVRVRVLIKAFNSRSASFHPGIYMNTCELNAREGNPAIEKRPVRGEERVETLLVASAVWVTLALLISFLVLDVRHLTPKIQCVNSVCFAFS